MTDKEKNLSNLSNFLTVSPDSIPRKLMRPLVLTLQSLCVIELERSAKQKPPEPKPLKPLSKKK